MHAWPAEQSPDLLRVDLAVLDHLLIAGGQPSRNLPRHGPDLPLEPGSWRVRLLDASAPPQEVTVREGHEAEVEFRAAP